MTYEVSVNTGGQIVKYNITQDEFNKLLQKLNSGVAFVDINSDTVNTKLIEVIKVI